MPCQIVVDGGGIATGRMVSPTIAGLIPGPTHESVFAMEAHGRALARERFPLGLNWDFQGVRKGGVLAGNLVSGMRFAAASVSSCDGFPPK